MNNKRPPHERIITFNGISDNLTGWANRLGCKPASLSRRISKWPLERALTEKPKKNERLLTFNGITDSIHGWARRTGVRPHTISARLKDNWPLERAFTEPVLRGFQRAQYERHAKTIAKMLEGFNHHPAPATVTTSVPTSTGG